MPFRGREMNRYDAVIARMRRGERIMIDGATGTEVERRGVPQLPHAWNGGGALSHPEIVRAVHEDYIRLGAQLVISNTFATSRHALRDAGEEARFADYNRRAVELAVEARQNAGADTVLVAGGISYWSWSGNHPPLPELGAGVAEQAVIMRDAGADLLMLEMMVDIDRMLVTLEAAQGAGLPVWVGVSCRPGDDGVMRLYNGDTLVDTIEALRPYDIPVLNIMHTSVPYIEGCLDITDRYWDTMVGIYPDTGKYEDDRMLFDSAITPRAFAEFAVSILERDFQLIGCCCGMGTEHIAALHDALLAAPDST